MIRESETSPLDPDDELGNIEAGEVPEGAVEPDPYIEDPNYNPEIGDVDPEEHGVELPEPEVDL